MRIFNGGKNHVISMRYVCLIAIAVGLAFAGLQTKAFAANSAQKARDAYVNAMAQGKIHIDAAVPFSYFDIDRDGFDELIAYPGFGADSYNVYTYYNGKIKSLLEIGQSYGNIALYPKKHVIAFEDCGHMGTYYDVYYRVSKGRISTAAERVYSQNEGGKPYDVSYRVNNKKVSKAKYSSYIQSLKQGAKTTHKGLSWNYFVGESPNFSNNKYYDFNGSKKTTTYHVAFKPEKSGSAYFQMAINRAVGYTAKATVTLCNSKKQAISKPFTLKDSGGFKNFAYKVIKNKIYNLKITAYNKVQPRGQYYSCFELLHSANPL